MRKVVLKMTRRLRILSIGIALIGIGFIAAGGFAYMKTQEGYKSLNAFSAAQNVTLTYNDQGQLVDGDDTGEAEGIDQRPVSGQRRSEEVQGGENARTGQVPEPDLVARDLG